MERNPIVFVDDLAIERMHTTNIDLTLHPQRRAGIKIKPMVNGTKVRWVKNFLKNSILI